MIDAERAACVWAFLCKRRLKRPQFHLDGSEVALSTGDAVCPEMEKWLVKLRTEQERRRAWRRAVKPGRRPPARRRWAFWITPRLRHGRGPPGNREPRRRHEQN